MKQFRTLRKDEIDVRIGTIKKDGSGLTLLLYKDARCDQSILDETVGPMNWQRHHSRDNANCIVSIWDEDKRMWVEKEDTGTESRTEKEKGLASDSFKRACFNWGIGRELYTAPFIWIKKGDFSVANDGKCYDNFTVDTIEYQPDGQREIRRLIIRNEKTGKVCFHWQTGERKAAPDNEPEQITIKTQKNSRKDVVIRFCTQHQIDGNVFTTIFRTYCKDTLNLNKPDPVITDLTDDQFDDMILSLNESLRKGAA